MSLNVSLLFSCALLFFFLLPSIRVSLSFLVSLFLLKPLSYCSQLAEQRQNCDYEPLTPNFSLSLIFPSLLSKDGDILFMLTVYVNPLFCSSHFSDVCTFVILYFPVISTMLLI